MSSVIETGHRLARELTLEAVIVSAVGTAGSWVVEQFLEDLPPEAKWVLKVGYVVVVVAIFVSLLGRKHKPKTAEAHEVSNSGTHVRNAEHAPALVYDERRVTVAVRILLGVAFAAVLAALFAFVFVDESPELTNPLAP